MGASFENVMLIRETSMYVCSSSGSGSGSGTKVTYAVELPNSYVVGSGLKAQGRLSFWILFSFPPSSTAAPIPPAPAPTICHLSSTIQLPLTSLSKKPP